jgi:protease-4
MRLRAVAALAGLLVASSGCDKGDGTSTGVGMLRGGLDLATGNGVVVELDLSHGLTEQAAPLSLFAGSAAPSHAEVVQAFTRAKTDRRTRGFLLRLGGAELDWAQAEELGRLFAALEPEKPVVCHAHGYSNKTLFFAARACDRVWLSPAGEVASVGLGVQMLYLKGLLDRFEVKADFLHMGRYKSAAETLTEEGPTEAARESLVSLLGSIRQTWLEGLAAARPAENLKQAAEQGPWSPDEALKAGLIDAVGYLTDARNEAKQRAQVDDIESSADLASRRNAADEIGQLLRAIAGASSADAAGEHVAVLTTAGAIAMEAEGIFGGDGIAAEPLGKTLRRLREDDSVKAVVLRIDSPGGSALASDLIWHELMRLREKKPLIASLASTAASGGYYMACAASRIIAERSTVLGSIGVVGGKIVFGEAIEQLGVNTVTLAGSDEPGAAERAAYLSPLTSWDEATREKVRSQMAAIYELFLSRVVQGRNLPIEHVRQVAEGRVWSGVQGLEHRLIDELGGLTEAISIAKKQAGLEDSAEVRIETAPDGLLELLGVSEEDEDEPEALTRETLTRALARLQSAPAAPLGLASLASTVAVPFRAHLGSLSPLLGNERVLTALPFALDLK